MHCLLPVVSEILYPKDPNLSVTPLERVTSFFALGSWVYGLYQKRLLIERVSFISCSAWMLGLLSHQVTIFSIFCSLCISYLFLDPSYLDEDKGKLLKELEGRDQKILSYKKKIEEYENHYQRLQKEINHLKNQNQTLCITQKEEFHSLEQKVEEMKKPFHHEVLQKEFAIEDLQEVNTSLQKKIQELEVRNDQLSLKISSFFTTTVDSFLGSSTEDNAPSSGALQESLGSQDPLNYFKLYVAKLDELLHRKAKEMGFEVFCLMKALSSFSRLIIENLEKKR